MRGMFIPLSPFEETALCKIGYGADDPLDQAHVRRLLQLKLVVWSGSKLSLTPLGQQRYDALLGDRSSVGRRPEE